MPVRELPAHPNVRQLKHQAKDLLRAARAGEPAALAAFTEFHPEPIDPPSAKLADAHLVLARSYQAASWPQLMAVCGLIEAISANDFETVRRLTRAHPTLVHDRRGGRHAGWRRAVVDAANLALRRVVMTLQGHGARDVSEALGRPDLRQWIEALRLLGQVGAQPPSDAVGGAVEILHAADFALMVEVGADVRGHKGLTALALETYTRNPEGKHRILETMAAQGVPLPDTPPMAVHRGRLDLLGRHLHRDPALPERTFSHQDIWPPSLECHADESLALHGAPLAGATLLHMAVDYEEHGIAEWLLDRGADVNARALVDSSGFGGHTPLFNCVVSYNAGRADDPLARLLLDRGADPNARASIRKRLPFARDKAVHEYRDVTPLSWGRRFHDQSYVSAAAMRLIAERGGRE